MIVFGTYGAYVGVYVKKVRWLILGACLVVSNVGCEVPSLSISGNAARYYDDERDYAYDIPPIAYVQDVLVKIYSFSWGCPVSRWSLKVDRYKKRVRIYQMWYTK